MITLSRIHCFSIFAASPGRNIEHKVNKKKFCSLGVAVENASMILGNSCHLNEGIEVTLGGAKTFETFVRGL